MIFNSHNIACLLFTFSCPLLSHTDQLSSRICVMFFPSLQYFMSFLMPGILLPIFTLLQASKFTRTVEAHTSLLVDPRQSAALSLLMPTTPHGMICLCVCSHGREHAQLLAPAPTTVLRNRGQAPNMFNARTEERILPFLVLAQEMFVVGSLRKHFLRIFT